MTENQSISPLKSFLGLVAFGPGQQEFSSDISTGGLVTLFFEGVSVGRCAFGVFALLIDFILAYAVGYSIWQLISPDVDKSSLE